MGLSERCYKLIYLFIIKQKAHIILNSIMVIKTALIQCAVGPDPKANVDNAAILIDKAAGAGAKLIILPECFNSPYGIEHFTKYSEHVPNGSTCNVLKALAKKHLIYLIGGTIPEVDDGKYYNTCTVWGPNGDLLTKYRKMHLFDVETPEVFKESNCFTQGSKMSSFLLDGARVSLGVCHDIRFEELARLYRNNGCDIIVYPSAFNMGTGSVHWELLQRARALDNQVHVLGASPARTEKGYITWAHSQVTDPWGTVVAKAGIGEEILYADIDLEIIKQVRQQIPIFKQRRTDVYDTIWKSS